jgi:hypothetical protein
MRYLDLIASTTPLDFVQRNFRIWMTGACFGVAPAKPLQAAFQEGDVV